MCKVNTIFKDRLLKFLCTVWILLWFPAPGRCGWDIRLTCPQTWKSGDTVTLVCEVNKKSVAEKCGYALNVTAFATTRHLFEPIITRNVFEPHREFIRNDTDFVNCSKGLSTSLPSHACQDNATHYAVFYKFDVRNGTHNGSWTCTKECSLQQSSSSTLVTQNGEHCNNVKIIDKPFAALSTGSQIGAHTWTVQLTIVEYTVAFLVNCKQAQF